MKNRLTPYGWLVLALLALGAVVRLADLGRASYQIDELATLQMWKGDHTPAAVIRHSLDTLSSWYRMPMLPLVNLAVMKTTNTLLTPALPPEFAARLPHALVGIATLPLLLWLGRRLGGPSAGLWALLLGTVSIFHGYYSREAYDYALLMFGTTATLLAGLRLLDALRTSQRVDGRSCALYIAASLFLLMSHLSGLVFLASFNALMALHALAHPDTRSRLRGPWLAAGLGSLAAAYVVFLPFLVRLVGFKSMGDRGVKFTWDAIPGVLGRMGWGEGALALAAFAAALVVGLLIAWGRRASWPHRHVLWLALQVFVYVAIQSWLLRVARFEVRYFSPAFPLLVVIAAYGLSEGLGRIAAARALRRPWTLHAAAGAVLLAWMTPSLFALVALEARGYDYKGIARWIGANVPEGGAYAFYNAYELRGVPGVYATPGRTGTAVAFWSTPEDFQRINPPERMRDLFTRFPQMAFVEILPEDVLVPSLGSPPLARSNVFARSTWVVDPATERLFALGTHPLGETQFSARHMHQGLMSINRPEDMPELARRNGRTLYHWFDEGWQYARDNAFQHWMAADRSAALRLGNLATGPQTVRVDLLVAAPPAGCRLRIYIGAKSAPNLFAVPGDRIATLTLDQVVLPPGEARILLEVLPPTGALQARLLLHAVRVEAAAPPPG